MHKVFQILTVGLVLGALIACGGGKDSSNSQSAPAADANSSAGNADTASSAASTVSAGPPTATLKGTVTLKGTPPVMKPLRQIKGNPDCSKLHTELPVSQQVVLGDGGKLVNAFVYITKGLEGRKFPPATEKKAFDQKACIYSPHALGLQVGQPLEISNSDATLHNVHMFPKKNKEVNRGQPKQGMTFKQTFRRAEPKPFKVKCDVHPWMNAWIGVFDHPYFAVTGADGGFQLPKLSAGNYTVTAWHEKLGQKTQEITIGDGETKELAFEFE